METIDLSRLMMEVKPVVAEAAAFIATHFRKTTAEHIEFKDARSLVSFVDKGAEEILVKGLGALLPDATFITEEDVVENEHSALTWVIDPLDGTTNFLQGIPFFCVSVALRSDHDTLLGIVHDVVHGEVFETVLGQGALVQGAPMLISDHTSFSDAVIATGFPYDGDGKTSAYFGILREVQSHARGVRRLGSAALDLAYVAAGRLDGYYEYNLNAWDIAAGALMVQEAGGIMRGFRSDLDWIDGKSMIAGHSLLVQRLHDIILDHL
ncbi:MAG: inositol monophosphatase [Saprospiraceae bacterium]|nr:inositol monophosphatase [Saprospiraceae bacterium]